jgi:predicted secreted protein
MAETVGTDFLLKAASNTVGGKSGATLTLERDSAELAPTQTTGVQFARSLTGLKDWNIDFDALWIADSSALNGFAPTVVVNPSGTNPPELSFIEEVTITLERDLVEFANTSNSEYISRQPSIVRASAEIVTDVEADTVYDTDTAEKALIDAWDSTSGKLDVELQLPNNNTSFSATWSVPSVEFDAPTEEATQITYSLESDGTITETLNANLGSGLNELLTNIFASNPSSFTALLTTEASGDIEFSGPVFPNEVEITIPVEGSEDGVNTSGSLQAAGALSIQETT